MHDQIGQRHESSEAFEVGLREGRIAVDEELVGDEDRALIDEERRPGVRVPRHLVHAELAHDVAPVVDLREGRRSVPLQPIEGEANEVPIATERPDERRKRGHVGEEIDHVRVVDRPTTGPIRHQIRRHPHLAGGNASLHEAPGEGRLAGPRGADELDDHRGRAMLPFDGATSRYTASVAARMIGKVKRAAM